MWYRECTMCRKTLSGKHDRPSDRGHAVCASCSRQLMATRALMNVPTNWPR